MINAADGSITHFQLFSDIGLGLTIELPPERLGELYQALAGIVNISQKGIENLFREEREEAILFLNLSFAKGRGNLRRKVPDFPG